MRALFLSAALLFSAPASAEEAASVAPPPSTPDALMELPAELRQRFHREVLASSATGQQRLEKLLHFMLDADALGIAYEEGATFSVAQTYAVRRANCLSFTLMFLALAREAGLPALPQEIEDTLAWHQDETTLYRNSHIIAVVRVGGRAFNVDTSGDTLITGDRPVAISEARLVAHYYNNLAMEQLALGNATAGLQLMDIALKMDPDNAPLWSNTGVLHVHAGDLPAAGEAYRRALAIDPEEDGALFNMVGLSRRLGDAKREADFRRRLARVQQKDPLHHFMLAMDYERATDYRQAIRHYRRAIRLHAGEHRFYSALARAYLKAGNPRGAGRALKRAQALTDGATRAAYRAQLQELKRPSYQSR